MSNKVKSGLFFGAIVLFYVAAQAAVNIIPGS